VLLIAAILLSGPILSPGLCQYDYTIVVEHLPDVPVPSAFVNLSTQDLADYPLIRRVLTAFGNTSSYAPAFMRDGVLHYPTPTRDDPVVTATNSYLVQRWGAGVYPLTLTTGDGEFYTWGLSVSDPGNFAPCP